ncbi:MAG TPA: hypothetical protein VME70_03270 [Mycobacteriales bacterium]|nr:hypothetical protein [Mycobacteriales bacterium]
MRAIRPLAMAAAAVLALSLSQVAEASATPDPHLTVHGHDRVLAITGTPNYLVYLRGTGRLIPSSAGTVYVKTNAGKPRRIAHRARGNPTWIDGSMLVITTGTTRYPVRLRWWDLANGQHGSLTLPGNEFPLAAAPNGWVSIRPAPGSTDGASQLIRHSTTGTTTVLGVPFPDGAGFDLSTGPRGLVAWTNHDASSTGRIVAMSWARPDRFRTLIKGVDLASCPSISARYAACYLQRATSTAVALVPLDGHKPTRTRKACPTDRPALLGVSVAWIARPTTPKPLPACAAGHFHILTRTGVTKTSRRTYEWYGLVSAFGRLVVTSRSERSLATLTSIGARPVPVVAPREPTGREPT